MITLDARSPVRWHVQGIQARGPVQAYCVRIVPTPRPFVAGPIALLVPPKTAMLSARFGGSSSASVWSGIGLPLLDDRIHELQWLARLCMPIAAPKCILG